MRSVLITGVFGFLGTSLLKYYKEQGWHVTGIGTSIVSTHENITLLDDYCMGSISERNLLLFKQKFDLIIHCAGSGSVGKVLENPIEEFKKTLEATQILLEYIRIYQLQTRLILTSSSAVYGTNHFSPIKESSKLNPMSLYGVHKELTEKLCSSYSELYSIKVSIIRYFSIYGPGLEKQLLWDACNKITSCKDESLVFFGTGMEIRDFIEIHDVITLIEKASSIEDSLIILNGGTGEGTTVKKIISTLVTLLNPDCKISFNNTVREGDPQYLCAEISKSKTYQWKPKIKLEEGLKIYVQWYNKQD
jgi:UDP-glucose 4-epimerase